MGLILLNQIGFQGQGFGFGIGDDDLNVDDQRHHDANPGAVVLLTVAKVRPNTIAEAFRFSDIENLLGGIFHKVNPRFLGDFL